ncbi:glycosyltransferase family 2 protein [Aurantibacter aestuarii]|uniref:Dolichol-phosphate mannosyltransferase n=1 Tax=Aurantibacter aestuarii TaxID=1266046 RepID=A0A2T1N9Q0_9FLAO|nr:glycosyltransferase family 2 protein [Aurantibacter aestuarii]PSG88606.1 dolichol-phosphate mannosyltransferase [Aurantibacter aestuarii]
MFTILVPVYNEAEALDDLKNALLDYLKIAALPTMVLFINDGSSDESLNLIQSYSESYKVFQYISLENNRGLSTALKAGIDHTKTEYLGYIDADLQTKPEDFNLLLSFLPEYDFITGIRVNRQDSFIKKISSKIANTVRNWFTKDGLKDTNCPLKVIKTNVAKKIPFYKGAHRFLPALVMLQNVSVKAIEIPHYRRIKGYSKFGISNRLGTSLIFCFIYLWMKRNKITYTITKQD